MKEMGVRAGRKDVVGSACRRAGVGCNSDVGGGRLEWDEDPGRTSVCWAGGGGGGWGGECPCKVEGGNRRGLESGPGVGTCLVGGWL